MKPPHVYCPICPSHLTASSHRSILGSVTCIKNVAANLPSIAALLSSTVLAIGIDDGEVCYLDKRNNAGFWKVSHRLPSIAALLASTVIGCAAWMVGVMRAVERSGGTGVQVMKTTKQTSTEAITYPQALKVHPAIFLYHTSWALQLSKKLRSAP